MLLEKGNVALPIQCSSPAGVLRPCGTSSRQPGTLIGVGPRDLLGRRLRDLRISVTDRCNFRCVYCMPREVFGPDFRVPAPRRAAHVRGDRAARAGSSSPLGVEKLRLTGGEPLLRRELERLVELLARDRRHRRTSRSPRTASLLARKAQAPGRRRAAAGHGEPRRRSTTRRSWRVNDAGVPVARVLEGSTPPPRPGSRRSRSTWSSSAASTRTASCRWRGTSAAPATSLRFIEYMDVGATNGWRLEDVVPAAEIVALIGAELPARAGRPELPRRGREPLALPRRRRRDRRDRVGHAAVLRRLHPRPAVGRGQALHLPLRQPGPRPARARARRRRRRRAARAIAAIWTRRGDRYSELRTAETARRPKVEMSHIGG